MLPIPISVLGTHAVVNADRNMYLFCYEILKTYPLDTLMMSLVVGFCFCQRSLFGVFLLVVFLGYFGILHIHYVQSLYHHSSTIHYHFTLSNPVPYSEYIPVNTYHANNLLNLNQTPFDQEFLDR